MKILKRFRSEDSGASTVEFVILFPILLVLCFAGIEGGWLMTRFMLVERGVDIAMRDVRLGVIENPSYDDLRDRICEMSSNIVKDCEQNLVLSTQVLAQSETVDPAPAPCFDRTATEEELEEFNPADGHNSGSGSQIVVVKVCAVVDPIFSLLDFTSHFGLDESGGFRIRTKTAFLHEPYETDVE